MIRGGKANMVSEAESGGNHEIRTRVFDDGFLRKRHSSQGYKVVRSRGL